MIQVKMISGHMAEVEVGINQFLRSIGSTPGVKAGLEDIKFIQDMANGNLIAMVIYSQSSVQPKQPNQSPTKP